MLKGPVEGLWQKDHHPQGLLWLLRDDKVTRTKTGRRKLRLFACGCSRLIWDQLTDSRHRDAVEVAERFADGLATKEQLEAARAAVTGLANGSYSPDDAGARERTAARMAQDTTASRAFEAAFGMTAYPEPLAGYGGKRTAADAALCELIRCIFGNPFRPAPTIGPHSLTSVVTRLASAIYTDRAFDRLPILADALEDAGCHDADILAHCRGPGPHVRGCWVVDLLTGRQ